jgi:hypothetical protein
MPDVMIPDDVWDDFAKLARRSRRKPEAVLEALLHDYVQQIRLEALLAYSERAAQRAPFDIEETEEIIRQLRKKGRVKSQNGKAERPDQRRV